MENSYYKERFILLILCFFVVNAFQKTDAQVEFIDTGEFIQCELLPIDDPFNCEDLLKIQLEFDIKKFIKEKDEDKYQSADLRVIWNDSVHNTMKIRLKARGNFRKEHCNFPPIKVSFKHTEFENEHKNEPEKMKMVTHCKNTKSYNQYMFKEFLCYKLYNILTDYSFRVRLLEVDYIDAKGNYKPTEKFGIIIEENRRLAERTNSLAIEMKGLSDKKTDFDSYHLMVLFQYFIGNTDWSVPSMHNMKLLKMNDISIEYPVPVPYDFDHSGMVNTYYAAPAERLSIETVRERLYLGYCIGEEEFQKYFNLFKEKKPELINLITACPYLNKKHRKEMLVYAEDFYKIIENPKLARYNIIDRCIK